MDFFKANSAEDTSLQSTDDEPSRQTNRRGELPRERVVRIFNETLPAVGEPLPDLTCFDEHGQPFKLRTVKGRFTVLLFGCLT